MKRGGDRQPRTTAGTPARTGGRAKAGARAAMELLRARCAQLRDVASARCAAAGSGPCTAPERCEGYEALGAVLDVAASAEAQLRAALAAAARERRAAARVAAALRDAAGREVATLGALGEERPAPARYTFDDLVGVDPEFVRVVDEARRAARSDVPVLVCGESGTGKELLAQAIHNASPRADEPFLGVNVAALPRELLDAELFGYEGGAFTGASPAGSPGKFELAGRGTLLLDELEELPLDLQGKFLRVLQERRVARIGGGDEVPVRARVIATSRRDLREAARLGRFRLDLFHRLRVLELHLPPLRERTGDVPLLVEHRLRSRRDPERRRARVARPVMAALRAYAWPGNVRQLFNVLDGELSVLPPGVDELTRIPAAVLPPAPAPAARAADEEVLPLDEVERRACDRALGAFHGNVTRAARALGVAKGTLYARMRRYGLRPPDAALADGDAPAPKAPPER